MPHLSQVGENTLATHAKHFGQASWRRDELILAGPVAGHQ
jgi:hypothetical protein